MNGRMRGFFLGLASAVMAACGTASAAPPDGPLLREVGRAVPAMPGAGDSGYGVADFDGDGMQDIAVGSHADDLVGSGLFKIYGAEASSFAVKQAVIARLEAPVILRAWTAPGGDARLLTIADDGTAVIYAGWPLQPTTSLTVEPHVTSAAIGDLDLDGQPDLVTLTGATLSAYDLSTGLLKWRLAGGGTDVAVAQLDADLPPEIVVAGMPGLVIDGATQAIEWSYLDGFGSHLAVGALAPGGAPGFVTSGLGRLVVFQSNPWSPLWDIASPGVGVVAAADLDGDGQAEIIANGPQWNGTIAVYDTATHAIRILIPRQPNSELRAVGSLDLIGDGQPLIAFTVRDWSGNGADVELADPVAGTIVTDLPAWRSGPYSAVAVGDFHGDGDLELAYGAMGFWRSGETGAVNIVEARSGAPVWASPAVNPFSNLPFNIEPVALRAHDNRLVVGGNLSDYARLTVMDLQTNEVAWQLPDDGTNPMSGMMLTGVALWDLDGDSVKDIVVSTQTASTANSGARLYAFSGVDGSTLWRSVLMGTGFMQSRGLVVGDTGYGGGPEMVAVVEGSIRAYNVETRLLDWVLPVDAAGVSLIPSGLSGIEIGVFSDNALHFYDGASHDLLRSVMLNGPIEAVHELDDIHHLLVAVDGHLAIVDGTSGAVLAKSAFLGYRLGWHNQLATVEIAPGSWLIGVGSNVGVFRYRLDLDDRIFSSGFAGP